ncbi:carbohydrate sulfotransferase 15-like [Ruditapes philippinarum]|uniref:carbohydrate sulfotransferase 15-like n=1 Tax=Ruditapes philippinarum TaxID=129788 RepID=UPI00295C3247|nr:carbohydrate sulfotransferase 15-like [Ruditapes philippinarum]
MTKSKDLLFIFLTSTCLGLFYIVDTLLFSASASLVGNEKQKTSVFKRVDTTPELTEKLPFSQNYKNPCWYEAAPELGKKLHCLPYYYVIGVPKCGTTDLCRRIMMHPSISNKVMKGNHWLTSFRFGKFRELSNYLRLFDYAVETDIRRKRNQDGFHNVIFGDCTPSISWNNRHMILQAKRDNKTVEPLSNAEIIKHLNPNSKIIVILRNPVERVYSEYLFFNGADNNPTEFHKRVVNSVSNMSACLQTDTLRTCIYSRPINSSHRKAEMVRLQVGVYHVFLEDFIKVFGRQQILIIKLENYSYHINQTMNKIFSFLDVGRVADPELNKNITTSSPANTRSGGDKLLGDMLPETRRILTEFYRPYNERLTELLGPEFNYTM